MAKLLGGTTIEGLLTVDADIETDEGDVILDSSTNTIDLGVLPTGSGNGLNADLLDGKHAGDFVDASGDSISGTLFSDLTPTADVGDAHPTGAEALSLRQNGNNRFRIYLEENNSDATEANTIFRSHSSSGSGGGRSYLGLNPIANEITLGNGDVLVPGGTISEQGNRVATRSWTNNNADVPDADYADSAGDADTIDGLEGSELAVRGQSESITNEWTFQQGLTVDKEQPIKGGYANLANGESQSNPITFDYSNNFLWWADERWSLSINDSTGISDAQNMFRAGDTYTSFNLSSTADPVIFEVTGFEVTTSSASAFRAMFQGHGSFNSYEDVEIEIKEDTGNWVTIGSWTNGDAGDGEPKFSSKTGNVSGLDANWPYRGIRLTLSNKVQTSGSDYIEHLGFYNGKITPAWSGIYLTRGNTGDADPQAMYDSINLNENDLQNVGSLNNTPVSDYLTTADEGSGNGINADKLDGYDANQLGVAQSSASFTSTDTSTDINTTSWTQIPWDVEKNVDAPYTHDSTNSPEQITFDEGGTYQVYVSLGYSSSTTDIRESPGVKFAINGTRRDAIGMGGYIRNESSHDDASTSIMETISVSAGDTLTVQTTEKGSTGVVTLNSQESTLEISSITTRTISQSDADTLDGKQASDFLLSAGGSMTGNLNATDSITVTRGGSQLDSNNSIESNGDWLGIDSNSTGNGVLVGYYNAPEIRLGNGGVTVTANGNDVVTSSDSAYDIQKNGSDTSGVINFKT